MDGHSAAVAKEKMMIKIPPRLYLMQLYGMVLPFAEMGDTLGLEFGGPFR